VYQVNNSVTFCGQPIGKRLAMNIFLTCEEAIQIAAEESVKFIQERNNISWTEAYMMTSIATDLLFSQVVNPLKTVRIRIPRKIIDN
jgi:acetamidase/formamidase